MDPTDDAPLVLNTRGLSKTHGAGPVAVHALRGVDLQIRRGEFIALLGQ
jgi:putative ABC transport system ATP-binding protein